MTGPSKWVFADATEGFGQIHAFCVVFWLKKPEMVSYCFCVALCCNQVKSPVLLSAGVWLLLTPVTL